MHVPFLRRNLLRAHAILKPPLRELSVALVGDARMAQLHERFMGIAGPTDVLTFPLDEDARGRVMTGEVVVCVPEALRQARQNGEKAERELLLYALHGVLHLCGHDDRTAADFRRMHRTEDEILTQLGVGPVFDRSLTSSSSSSSRSVRTIRATNRDGTRRASSPRAKVGDNAYTAPRDTRKGARR